MFWATKQNESEVIRLLALAGANLDLFDKDGVTPLACAVSSLS